MCIPPTVSIMETKDMYIVYSYDPFNCGVKRNRFSSLEKAEIYFDECTERAFIIKVEDNKEILIKEKNID